MGQSDSFRRRDMDVLIVITQRLALLWEQQVNLVHHFQSRLFVGFEFLENTFHLRVLLGRNRTARIRDLHDERGALYFFERGAERRYQSMRKMPDETHCVREQNFAL